MENAVFFYQGKTWEASRHHEHSRTPPYVQRSLVQRTHPVRCSRIFQDIKMNKNPHDWSMYCMVDWCGSLKLGFLLVHVDPLIWLHTWIRWEMNIEGAKNCHRVRCERKILNSVVAPAMFLWCMEPIGAMDFPVIMEDKESYILLANLRQTCSAVFSRETIDWCQGFSL